MKRIQSIEVNDSSREELLPGFSPDFPYIATCAELDKYIEPVVPWHWHRTVELFYMESGELEYTTPKGRWTFPVGSGGMVNSNVLHTTRWRAVGESNVQLLHLFEPSLLSGNHGSRIEEKYILPLTEASGVELIPLFPEEPAQAEILRDIRRAFDMSEHEWGYEFMLRESLSRIWLKLLAQARTVQEEGSRRDSDVQIKVMMVYIHEHFREQISVEQLARTAHISKRACFRISCT